MADQTHVDVFDDVKEDYHFNVKNKKTGQEDRYKIIEVDGVDHDKWLKLQASRFNVNANTGKVETKDFKGMNEEILSLTVRTWDGERVPRTVIDAWGTNLKNRLVGRSEAHNGMSKRAEEREGND